MIEQFELDLISTCKKFGNVSWFSGNNATFPQIILNYISDIREIYLDGGHRGKSGRISITILSKDDATLLKIKNALQKEIQDELAGTYGLITNTGLSAYDYNVKTFIYQMDFNFSF